MFCDTVYNCSLLNLNSPAETDKNSIIKTGINRNGQGMKRTGCFASG
jgi:hypothetical protein